MTKSTSFILSDHFEAFIEGLIATGRYSSASDVVRAGLRLLEERDRRLKALDAALQEGIDSGPAVPFDFDEFLREMHETYIDKDAVA